MSQSTTVLLRHATPFRHLQSILNNGLLPAMARGKLKVVHLHTKSKTEWAIPHVARRHNTTEDGVVILTVIVPRSSLRRHARGWWMSAEPIAPEQIISVRPVFALS